MDKPIGLEYLVINNSKISLSANARIFNENYKLGLSLNTLDHLKEVLKANGLELYPNFAEETNLSLAHVKNDIKLNYANLVQELSFIENPKYSKTIRDNSITFENTNKGDMMTTVFYGKYLEMTKGNKSHYLGLNVEVSDFEGVTRMESKFNDWRTVKKFFGTRNLMEILKSKNVNYSIFSRLTKDLPLDTPRLDLSQFKTISQLDDYARTKLLFEQCKGNYGLMTAEIKKRLGRNTKPTYQIKKIKKIFPLVQTPGGRKLESVISLKSKLKE